ncbi:hypothetical protein POPTR_009G046000v4 [Populus trichocarpa]|uniref:Uncharacterized protein n=4 Tax=Populus trichocarpa TaxID=3694 RepID=A0ACC0SGI3_POPTR|nr:hypothetical protein POPTR_009G046000v4 [Populus trichocarpa]KAI9388318.1 hypothetical protein POPTR_009G046000v4 [Populus trichocarpa]KAI9388319.1 hypothetical protein POPTR_009G046000v4 [Populus trichocarpa]PNT19574.1 hypothetical protein POPTR_009G046000v4 [Populus trichocarpa]
MAEKLAPEKRHSFVREDKTVFEWDQTLEEVNIYINLPPNVHSKQFYCKIQSKHAFISMSRNPDDLLVNGTSICVSPFSPETLISLPVL